MLVFNQPQSLHVHCSLTCYSHVIFYTADHHHQHLNLLFLVQKHVWCTGMMCNLCNIWPMYDAQVSHRYCLFLFPAQMFNVFFFSHRYYILENRPRNIYGMVCHSCQNAPRNTKECKTKNKHLHHYTVCCPSSPKRKSWCGSTLMHHHTLCFISQVFFFITFWMKDLTYIKPWRSLTVKTLKMKTWKVKTSRRLPANLQITVARSKVRIW